MIPFHPQAIIFDMDGTLVDSEQMHIDSWLYIFKKYNIPLQEHDIHQWIGVSDVLICTQLVEKFQLPIAGSTLLDEKRIYYRSEAQPHVKPIKGVFDEIEKLKHLPMAVATMSSRYEADKSLLYTGLNTYFKIVVTADDVENHKPAPDCFLKAAEMLGVDPNRCIALEDSVSGVSAAKAAGMFTIGVGNTIPLEKLQHADLVFKNSADCLEFLTELLAN